MRLRLALALLTGALLANGAQAESNDMHILIGSYTHDSDSPGVLRLRFDPSQGRLEPEPLQALTSHNPSWLVLDERRGRLYATHENGPAHADPVGRVGAWQRDAKGDYQPIGQAISLGDEPTHASLSADGRYLFVSNYGSRPNPGGSLAVLPLDEDGRPLPVTQIAAHQASGVHPNARHRLTCIRRCPARTARAFWSATWAPTGCSSTATTRAMPSARCGRMSRPASSCPRAGPAPSGVPSQWQTRLPRPRTERPGGWLRLHQWHLTRRQLLDLKESDSEVRHSPGAIHTSADGRFLYVSDRGDYNHIIVFAIEADGTLREIQRRPSEGREPRSSPSRRTVASC